jgi:hypothetical protein
MEPDSLLLRSKDTSTGPYLKPVEISAYNISLQDPY